ncbi:RNA polymerase II elongation factor [Fasciola gigantica]|uniref:RNA polymerase II elongation factor n=1 Tax=Fasciola gigantica TaxID=46835 RepID=A0A504YD71_FASGI|nr:RNA polymerase II elongation factor [Fasciola gigantica]
MEETERVAHRLECMLKTGKDEDEPALKYLCRLKGIETNLDILTKTGVGIIINKIRKERENPEVATLGKNIIKQWKKLVPDKVESSATPTIASKRLSNANNGVGSDDGGASEVKRARPEEVEANDSPKVSSTDPADSTMNTTNSGASEGYFPAQMHVTTDEVRLKARQMIQSALKVGTIPTGEYESELLVIRIESVIYDLLNNTDSKYKQRVRKRVMNLRHSDNPNLRLIVLMGHVNPTKLAPMTSEETASKEMKELREKYTRETIEDHQMAVTGGT